MQSCGGWAAPPDCPCRETTFSMLLTHSWEGGSPRPFMSHPALPQGPHSRHGCKRSRKCHCWTHKAPALQGDSVWQLGTHHHCALQAKDHYFFQQKGGNIFGRARILNGFCLTQLGAGSSHLESSTSRVGRDIKQCEVLIPRDTGTHLEVPDILHPHLSPPHPGS